MNKKIYMAGLMALVLSGGAAQAFAHGIPAMGGGNGYGRGGDPLARTFFKQVHFVMRSQEKLGLSEDQINAVRSLKLEVEKSLIRQKAETRVSEVEIESALRQDKVDAEALQKLIDEEYEGRKAQAKTLAAAYLKLKDTLTPEQQKSLQGLKKEGIKRAFEGNAAGFRHHFQD